MHDPSLISELFQVKTADYRPPIDSRVFFIDQGLPPFTLRTAYAMLEDSQVKLGTAIRIAPLLLPRIRLTGDPQIVQFVRETLTDIWQRDIQDIISGLWYGVAGGELVYKQDQRTGQVRLKNFKPMYPGDLTLLHNGNKPVGLKITPGGAARNLGTSSYRDSVGTQDSVLRGMKSFVFINRPLFGEWLGRSDLSGAYNPWLEKADWKGAKHSRKLWFYKNAFGGGIIFHPPGTYDHVLPDGTTRRIPYRDLARQAITQAENGAVYAFEMVLHPETKEPLWKIEPPTINGDGTGLIEYVKELDLEIMRGLGIPDDVVSQDSGTGSFAGRTIPLQAFFLSMTTTLREIFDAIREQIVDPLVRLNFGKGAEDRYDVQAVLVDTEALMPTTPSQKNPQAGGQGISDSSGVMQVGDGKASFETNGQQSTQFSDSAGNPIRQDDFRPGVDDRRPEYTIPVEPEQFSFDETKHRRAPKGGITVGGTFFPGGKFIPKAAIANASPQERHALYAADRKAAGKPSFPIHRPEVTWENAKTVHNALVRQGLDPAQIKAEFAAWRKQRKELIGSYQSGKRQKPTVEQEAAAFKRYLDVKSPYFKQWFGDWQADPANASKAIDPATGEPDETHPFSQVVGEDGKPQIVYHGTTHNFDAFDPKKANYINHLGQGFYFSSNLLDSQKNYGHDDGPDIRNRISELAESITDNLSNGGDWSDYLTEEEAMDYADGEELDDVDWSSMAEDIARAKLAGDTPQVIPFYLNLRNPVTLKADSYKDNTGGTYYSYDYPSPPDDDDGDWEPEIDQNQPGAKLLQAIRTVAAGYTKEGYDPLDGEALASEVEQHMLDYGGISAFQLHRLLSNSDEGMYAAFDYDAAPSDPTGRGLGGQMAFGQLMNDIFREMGHDGVIYNDAHDYFPNMVSEGTRHYIAFHPEQIKSLDNQGTYNPQEKRYRMSRDFDESEHPRQPAGSAKGGQFAKYKFGQRIPADEATRLVQSVRAGDSRSKNQGRATHERNLGDMVYSKLPTNYLDGISDPDYGNMTGWLRATTNADRVASYVEDKPDAPIHVTLNRKGNVAFSDGAHRLLAAIDRGDKEIDALMPPELHERIHGKQDDSSSGNFQVRQWASQHFADPAHAEAFTKWFGDSKVVNEKGEPLVVYHGTGYGSDFDEFNPHTPQSVFMLDGQEIQRADGDALGPDSTGSPEKYHYGALSDALTLGVDKALAFRTDEAERSRKWREEQGRSGTSPDTERHLKDLKRLAGKRIEKQDVVRPSGDGTWFTPSLNYSFTSREGVGGQGAVKPVYLSIKNPVYLNGAEIESAGRSWQIEKYRAQGYDGAIFAPYKDDLAKDGWSGATQIVIFDSNQAKSATGNQGTFDPNNPKITMSRDADDTKGHWVTIGAKHDGEDFKGGTPVYIEGGKITKGPKALMGRSMEHLTAQTAKAKRKDAVKQAAERHEVDAEELDRMIDSVHAELTYLHNEHESIKEHARKLSGLTAGKLAALENSGLDKASVPNFDQYVEELQAAYPGHIDSKDPESSVWELIREGRQHPPAKYSKTVVDAAAERLKSSKTDGEPVEFPYDAQWDAPPDYTIVDDEVIPFAE